MNAIELLLHGSAWLVFTVALIAAGCNIRYLYLHWHGEKRYLKLFTIIAVLYVAVLYALMGSSMLTISVLAALMGRAGILILLSLLTAEVIADWNYEDTK